MMKRHTAYFFASASLLRTQISRENCERSVK